MSEIEKLSINYNKMRNTILLPYRNHKIKLLFSLSLIIVACFQYNHFFIRTKFCLDKTIRYYIK